MFWKYSYTINIKLNAVHFQTKSNFISTIKKQGEELVGKIQCNTIQYYFIEKAVNSKAVLICDQQNLQATVIAALICRC